MILRVSIGVMYNSMTRKCQNAHIRYAMLVDSLSMARTNNSEVSMYSRYHLNPSSPSLFPSLASLPIIGMLGSRSKHPAIKYLQVLQPMLSMTKISNS